MTRRIGQGDPQRGAARVVLGLLAISLTVLLFGVALPSIAATSAATATSSPTAVATESNTPASATPQPTPSAPKVQLLNPSQYESPVIVSDKSDSDTLYHFVAVVSHAPTNAVVQITMQALNSANPPQPTGQVFTVCDPATPRGADTFDCFGDISGRSDGSYRVTARLTDNSNTTLDSDSQDVQIMHAGESLEITSPADAGDLGLFAPAGGRPGFLMNVKYSSGTVAVKAFYTTSPLGTEPTWRRCSTQVTTYYADHTASIGCEVASGVGVTDLTGISALAQQAQPDLTFPNCTPDIPPGGITCPQPPADQSGDAHRVVSYQQGPGGVALNPANQAVADNSDNSQCAVVTATVTDQKQNPVWRANVDVHATGPGDSVQFAVGPGTSPFKNPDQDHDGAEAAYNCTSKGNDASHNQGIHAVVSGPDVKHIESTTGTDTSGQFVFGLHSGPDGTTTLGAWWDFIDDDAVINGENVTPGSVAWGNVSPSGSSSPSATASATASATTSASPTTSPTATATTSPPPSSTSSSTATLPPPPAVAKTTITIHYDANGHSPSRAGQPRASGSGVFKGKVKSAAGRCRNSRKVKLVRVHHGVIGHTRSHGGKWSIFHPNAHGTFYAKVLRKVFINSSGSQVTCLADKSPKVHV
jgi:hypothetical protein